MTPKQRRDLEDEQLTSTMIMDLESLLDGLRQTDEDGALVVSYGPREDTDGQSVLTLWGADNSEQYLYPEVLERIWDWVQGLPMQPPKEAA